MRQPSRRNEACGTAWRRGRDDREQQAGRMNSRTVWLIGGTRPEAIKLAPVVMALADQRSIRPVVVATGQHPSMFQKGLATFGLQPDRELRPDRATGGQAELVAQLTERLDVELRVDSPDAVVVQGDTSSALVGALAAFWRQIRVVHLEAGLRSHDLAAPFPEEANRRMVDQIAALHLAPTQAAAANLLAEGIPAEKIEVIGNTVVDAVLMVAGTAQRFCEAALEPVDALMSAGRRLMLVTVHRRESWGQPMRSVLHAVGDILDRHPDLVAVLPVHPNPSVRADVVSVLGTDRRVIISPPVDYPDFVRLLELSALVLSDSGGIQEEAPSLGVPVLVLRDKTERLEAIQAGCAFLVGTDRLRIVAEASRLLSGGVWRTSISSNPFGDGHAGERAAIALARLVGIPAKPELTGLGASESL
jgi:UDP-N-acetylglucosamine 2-epimerase (non-hydrolysing)